MKSRLAGYSGGLRRRTGAIQRSSTAISLLFALAPAAAGASMNYGQIGIFADTAGTLACAEVPTGSYAFLHVLASNGEYYSDDLTAVEFRIEVTQPEGWVISYIPPTGAILIGNPIDRLPAEPHDDSGANVAFSTCQHWDVNGRFDLGTLFVRNEGGAPTELLVKRRSRPTNSLWRCALFTNCDPTYWSMCNTPLLASSCTTFIEASDAGGDCDKPYSVFGLDREPDPRWIAPPRPRAGNREVLAMLARRSFIELPAGEVEAPLARAVVHSQRLNEALHRYAVEWVGKGMPCFDLADTMAVTDHGDTVRLIDWSKLWVFTLPTGASMQGFIESLSLLREVIYAEPNGGGIEFNGTESPTFSAPNPLVQRGNLKVMVARPTSGRIEIFDAAGRRVRVLADRALTAGANQLFWDGTDDAGQRLRSGVYFVQVIAGAHHSTHKLVYMR